MPNKHIFTEVDGNKIKLSNLDKLIYPYAGIIKAEIIQYYKEVAPFILKYIKNRPLTLIRFPDGIEGTKFYAKDKPKWAPQWINSARISDDDNDYILASRTSDMIWLSNLAALEIHPMQIQAPNFDYPDHFIFDLDPSPGFGFQKLKEIAFELKEFLNEYNYYPFIKTSGSKGLHIYVPILQKYNHDIFIERIKSLAKAFIAKFPDTCTLRINKEKRVGKVLIDIYRNHRSNSCIAPYSLRAKPHAPVSMPIYWSELEGIESAQHFKMQDVLLRLKSTPDAWEDFYKHSVPLHDQEVVHTLRNEKANLGLYDSKRDFKKTSEPISEVVSGNNDQFVIQLHDASNLHFDLRLEYNGVLLSWAIPKALPSGTEEKRLAIKTEDHPIKYLDFEGKIPKAEYGGGEMWVFDRGTYILHKYEQKKISFTLKGKYFRASYMLINTRENQWLLSLDGKSELRKVATDFQPMLAGMRSKVPSGTKYIYEVKWDGIRALLHLKNGVLKITSRSGSDLSKQFPEFHAEIPIDAQEAILDGEIVVLNESGVSDFPQVISRLHTKGKLSIEKIAKHKKAVFYAFDLLFLDGRQVYQEAFTRRRDWLKVIVKKGQTYRISDVFEDGTALFSAGKAMGLEGIMAKVKDARYFPGERSDNWIKVKYRENLEASIIGYTAGSGERSSH